MEVTCRHLAPEDAAVVEDWFAGRVEPLRRSGGRSVLLPAPGKPDRALKIKGAGLAGSGIGFGTYRRTGPLAPLFDFDGRMIEDIGLSHDGAYVGGASLQQAATEWRVSRELAEAGFDVLPCLGYGSVVKDGLASWFSVFEIDPAWPETVFPPRGEMADYRYLCRAESRLKLEILQKLSLCGYFFVLKGPGKRAIIKDVHPFRRLDPVNQSQLSWVLHVALIFHMSAIQTHLSCQALPGRPPPGAPLWSFQGILKDVTAEDWDQFRHKILTKHILKLAPDHEPLALLDKLAGNRITARLMELCPPEYARHR
ncbi:hypothetical protein [Pseudoroseicyclus sp. CXY001]|uniref:hypothetical protein n=1 Tax=Pseudoroseicyclus sp. CXY001 TaxID=3242492 RepID=UPI00358DACA7